MKRLRPLRAIAVVLAVVNWLMPWSEAMGVQPPALGGGAVVSAGTRPTIHDIALGTGGKLRGRVLDATGRPVAGFQLAVMQNARQVALVASDSEGRFAASGLYGGLFQVVSSGGAYVCRGWAAGTAPPVANSQLLLVPEQLVQRGQQPFADLFFADPIMIGVIVAAAIAVPIAVSRSKSEPPPGS